MAIRKPSAARSVMIVVAVLLLGIIVRRERMEEAFRFPSPPGAGAGGPRGEGSGEGSAIEPEPAPLPPKEGRDAPAALAPWKIGQLSGVGADWNAALGSGAFTVTVARREASGKVVVTRESAAPAIRAERFRPRERAAEGGRGRAKAEPRTSPGRAGRARRARSGPRADRGSGAQAGELDLELEAWEPEDPSEEEVASPGRASLGRRIASWFSRARERREARRRRGARKLRLSLRQLLGQGILRPPSGRLVPPDFSALGPAPKLPKGGGDWPRLKAAELERLAPPDAEEGYLRWYRDVRSNPGHWHRGERGEYYHKTGAWGVMIEGPRWAWLPKSADRWWALGEKAPLVWHGAHWWWKTEDGWFLLHRGQAWAYRFFNDLERDGLFEPESRARVVYSADARRVAVIIPGRETIVYDLESGQILGRIPAE